MDNIDTDVLEEEVIASTRQEPKANIREALESNLPGDTEVTVDDGTPEDPREAQVEAEPQEAPPALLPPADMRAEEKEAFLNPTAKNAHILQAYLNRRAYETRSDYQRRVQELEDARKVTTPLVDVVKKYEGEYVRRNLNIQDVARRAIEWDQAMSTNPVQAAYQWLESYGLSPLDLMAASGQIPQQAPQGEYLTREQAEEIADQKYQAIIEEHKQNAIASYNQQVVESFVQSKPIFRDPETASQIENDMAPIVKALTATGKYSSPQEILETAYNYVINGNPTYSGLVQRMTAKPRVDQQMAITERAKAASRSISGSPGTGTPSIKTKNLRENLERRLVGE